MKKKIAAILIGVALSGCATHMENIHPEWNPPKGIDEAVEKCNASSKYAWNKLGAYAQCMAAFGYERRSGPKTQ